MTGLTAMQPKPYNPTLIFFLHNVIKLSLISILLTAVDFSAANML